jgi:endonuclease/exonuclease/phosphatase (EEP) superfamily protein YafD
MAAALLGLSLPVWLPAVPRYRGAWARLAWLPDLAVHWQWAYGALWGMTLLVGAWLASTHPRSGAAPRGWIALVACALVGAALGAGNLSMWVLPGLERASEAAATPRTLRVASFNVNLDNAEHQRIAQWVKELNPDVLALLEVTPAMQPLLDALRPHYPYAVVQLRDDPFGLAVLSRYQLLDEGIKQVNGCTLSLTAHLMLPVLPEGHGVLLNVLHPTPPISPELRFDRDAAIRALAPTDLLSHGTNAIALGDFNATAWTPAVRDLAQQGWARATTLQPTWMGVLPIDHILATHAHWQVLRTGVGPRLGSDHHPVWADLVMKVERPSLSKQ